MGQKFHINAQGVPAPCRATKGNCPFGGADGTENHFDTVEEAQIQADIANEAKYSLLPNSELNLSPAASQKLETQLVVMKGTIDPDKFNKPTGNMGNNKPYNGGLWTSSKNEDGESGWTKWARGQSFYRNNTDRDSQDVSIVEISPDANVLTIDNAEDYAKIIAKYKEEEGKYGDEPRLTDTSIGVGPTELLDYDKLMEDYDGLRVTDNAIKENPEEFSHWSTESTVWFNLDHFESVEHAEGAYDENRDELKSLEGYDEESRMYKREDMKVNEQYEVAVAELADGEFEKEKMKLSRIEEHEGRDVYVFEDEHGYPYITYNHGKGIDWDFVEEINYEFG